MSNKSDKSDKNEIPFISEAKAKKLGHVNGPNTFGGAGILPEKYYEEYAKMFKPKKNEKPQVGVSHLLDALNLPPSKSEQLNGTELLNWIVKKGQELNKGHSTLDFGNVTVEKPIITLTPKTSAEMMKENQEHTAALNKKVNEQVKEMFERLGIKPKSNDDGRKF